jgi:ribosomal protein S21
MNKAPKVISNRAKRRRIRDKHKQAMERANFLWEGGEAQYRRFLESHLDWHLDMVGIARSEKAINEIREHLERTANDAHDRMPMEHTLGHMGITNIPMREALRDLVKERGKIQERINSWKSRDAYEPVSEITKRREIEREVRKLLGGWFPGKRTKKFLDRYDAARERFSSEPYTRTRDAALKSALIKAGVEPDRRRGARKG